MKATVLWIGAGTVVLGGAIDGCGGTLGGDPGTAGRGGMAAGSGQGGAGGTADENAFGQPACLPTVTKGGACAPADQPFCFKRCGPESTGVKSETCASGVYVEMSGCAYDPAKDYGCYSVPAVVGNPMCGAEMPQASAPCAVPSCTLCNSLQGLSGGAYLDSAGAMKIGYCVCTDPGASGSKWSCAQETSWPCPGGNGCRSVTGGGGSISVGGAAGTGGGGAGGVAGTGGSGGSGGSAFGEPACPATVAKGGACAPTDAQFCYKTCGPEKTGVKSETCQTSGSYAEMSGCLFDSSRDYSCYKLPTTENAACGAGVTPIAGSTCDAPICTVCDSLQGLAGGTYLDSSGAVKVGHCVCQAPNSAGQRTWSCATDTAWPCPGNAGC